MAFPAPEVKWFKDGQPIRPSQAVNFINQPGGVIGLSIDSCKPEDAGVYSLTVTNKLGEVCPLFTLLLFYLLYSLFLLNSKITNFDISRVMKSVE